ncbi:fasciclin domain-containing protein [Maritimibacter sp. DP1N21-5]|uniref:fasciclin domain-containing protein n=1 Tax=Maritimibacter sp. DP1N21-5 TaxID=2836867 RepID=UPI001C48B454|nr:fasciclin domain-containing protein [Maritimibacter sp. DP1N21-5]MBV7410474.1 fasciclin domain-containing protein [Maritimibacter sp. DP1N21-5]
MKTLTKLAVAGTISASLFATAASAETIAEIAAGNEDFSTLMAAVEAAGLGETLAGEGPFTVFAPTNAAFEALPEGTVESLLAPDMKEDLTNILLYHVVGANVPSGDIAEGTAAVETVAGPAVCVTKGADGVSLTDGAGNTAMVVTADIAADNGVIHVIDTVIMPGESGASC